MNVRPVSTLAIIFGFGLVCTAAAAPKASIETMHPDQPIPTGFKTYSVFLICNPQWLDAGMNAGLIQLHKQFLNFGRAIGEENAAVWFWTADNHSFNDDQVAKYIDVDRSVRFCKAWKLKPSAGPHIVITSSYPDEAQLTTGLPAGNAVYKLANMTPEQIAGLLAKLTDQLVLSDKGDAATSGSTDDSAASAAVPADSLWVRLLGATQQTLNNFGCAWTLKISAGPVSADLKSCKNT